MQNKNATLHVRSNETKFNTALNMSSASINLDDENEDQSTERLVEYPENNNATSNGEINEEYGNNMIDISTDSSTV